LACAIFLRRRRSLVRAKVARRMLTEKSHRRAKKLVRSSKASGSNVGRQFVSTALQAHERVESRAAGISNESLAGRYLGTYHLVMELDNQPKPDILCRTCCKNGMREKNVMSCYDENHEENESRRNLQKRSFAQGVAELAGCPLPRMA